MKMKKRKVPDHKASRPLITQSLKPYLLWLVWLVWLPFLTPNFVELFEASTPLPQIVFSLVAVLFFFAIYLAATWETVRLYASPDLAPLAATVSLWVWLALGSLVGLATGLVLLDGKDWFVMFYYVTGYLAGRLPTLKAVRVVVGLALLIIGLGLVSGAGWYFTGQAVLYVSAIGVITLSIVNAVMTSRKLRQAQAEVARLAVTNERLRIARDLHDLLGHNLSLIALKSELSGRLIKIAPERASTEIKDVEEVARATLSEVREAVSNYRQPSLTHELKGAGEVLAAAGISYHPELNQMLVTSLPGPLETVLAWAVREGITNVIRHSHSKECTLRLNQPGQQIVLEIINPGSGPQPGEMTINEESKPAAFALADNKPGNGLKGLTERVAALEGHCQAGFDTAGNFKLKVSLPLVSAATPTLTPEQPGQENPKGKSKSKSRRGEQAG
jgi:two-component system sensor histidine kinase DesK